MFEQVMVGEIEKGHRAMTTMLGMAGQTLLITAAVLVPLLSPQGLPRVQLLPAIFTPHAPAPPPPPAAVRIVDTQIARPTQLTRTGLVLPQSMPAKPAIIDDPPAPAGFIGGGTPGGVPGGIADGIPGGVLNSIVGAVPPPKPPAPVAQAAAAPPAAPAAPPRIRLGGVVLQAKLIRQVTPVYPMLARQARISGVVELVGIVGIDGRIQQLQVSSGHPLLIKAAVDAVSQWIYCPTLLNGEPVEVMAPITVTFTLNR